MTKKQFRKFRQISIHRLRALEGLLPGGSYDEQALPAYAIRNPFSNWLFWQRLSITIRLIRKVPRQEVAVDFGSGLGLMLPVLMDLADEVIAIEREPNKLEEGMKALHIDIPKLRIEKSIDMLLPSFEQRAGIVLAMDVLEHVDDLERTLFDIRRIMKPEGLLIITGPTENAIYRWGRRLAGFSGAYHLRNIYDIEWEGRQGFQLLRRRVLFPLCPLFIVLEMRPKPVFNGI